MIFADIEDGCHIFVDANILVYHFSRKSRFNAASTTFLERIERREIVGVTSTAVVQEATHRLMIMEAVAIVDDNVKNIVKYLKVNPNIVKKLVKHRAIPEKIASFNLEIVSPDMGAIIRSQDMKRRYGLLSNDSLALQIMEDMQIKNIASNDADFEMVNFIKLYKPSVTDELSAQ
jgi:predicted nucleic acid-binding protein